MKKEKRPKQKVQKQKRPKRDTLAIIKTETRAKVLRIILYILLGFIFIRGAVTLVRASPESELVTAQKSFLQNVDNNTSKQVLVSSFAEGFIKNYCTYKKKDEAAYKLRLEPYTGAELAADITGGIKLVDDADAVYTQTLYLEKISESQYNVTVMADVLYTKYPTATASTLPTGEIIPPEALNSFVQKQTIYYKVPVYFNENHCMIEDYPIITVQPAPSAYTKNNITLSEVTDGRKAEIKTLANDFTKALFEESQNKINYYLADVQSTNNFEALQTTMKYMGIQDILVYEAAPDKYLAVVTIKTADINGSVFQQRFTLSIVKKDRYLIDALMLRTHNLGGI